MLDQPASRCCTLIVAFATQTAKLDTNPRFRATGQITARLVYTKLSSLNHSSAVGPSSCDAGPLVALPRSTRLRLSPSRGCPHRPHRLEHNHGPARRAGCAWPRQDRPLAAPSVVLRSAVLIDVDVDVGSQLLFMQPTRGCLGFTLRDIVRTGAS